MIAFLSVIDGRVTDDEKLITLWRDGRLPLFLVSFSFFFFLLFVYFVDSTFCSFRFLLIRSSNAPHVTYLLLPTFSYACHSCVLLATIYKLPSRRSRGLSLIGICSAKSESIGEERSCELIFLAFLWPFWIHRWQLCVSKKVGWVWLLFDFNSI